MSGDGTRGRCSGGGGGKGAVSTELSGGQLQMQWDGRTTNRGTLGRQMSAERRSDRGGQEDGTAPYHRPPGKRL